jgi:hypothetical protein
VVFVGGRASDNRDEPLSLRGVDRLTFGRALRLIIKLAYDEEKTVKEKLAELKADFERGQQRLQLLDQQRAELRDTLLRISGAIQILEELIAQNDQDNHKEAEHPSLAELRS